MDPITVYGVCALTFMMAMYALERHFERWNAERERSVKAAARRHRRAQGTR